MEIKNARAKLLSGTPTQSTMNSQYEVHILILVRDEDGKLIAYNTDYLAALNYLSHYKYSNYKDWNDFYS